MKGRPTGGAAFTLIELLVVVSIIALLVAILLPSLTKARKQAKSVVCFSNLKSMGTGILTYATEYGDRLPGPLHPAVYKYQIEGDTEWERYLRGRQLTYVLASTLGQRGGAGAQKNITDDIADCPVMSAIVPDSHFYAVQAATGRGISPTHYAMNHYGSFTAEQTGVVGNFRLTSPMYYFGYSPPQLPSQWSETTRQEVVNNPPQPTARIRRPSEEWVLADAWYRPRVNTGYPELQQEGPYQSSWSGIALPSFAPHFKRGSRSVPIDEGERTVVGALVRKKKADGRTNAVFFDGHAAGEVSRTLECEGWDLLYGFRGTMNPNTPLDPCMRWR
ncbi:MAG: prepilin-type N-terminal cleavage/methylation domain-containing protein [Phycisphaerales bacterium]|nr:MAG: prepilin-type N-terminal cleavage/methylation domain-containing protein [Phycisphaerales bacterium]